MNRSLWKTLQPHVIAIAIFFLVSCFYCLPAFKGMVVDQPDVQTYYGGAQQSYDFKEKYGRYPLWSNSMFSGMPSFQIFLQSQYHIPLLPEKYNWTIAHFHHVLTLFLPEPASLFFLACIGFYILAITLRLPNWLGIFGGIGYAFASYSAVIVIAGHTTKFASMGYMPAVIAGLILLTQKRYLLGFLTTMFFSTLMVYQNHLQIVYYTFLVAVILAIAFIVKSIREKDVLHFVKTAGLAALAGIIALASYAVVLLPTYDYTQETLRGGRSELTDETQKNNKTKGGLDKEYAFSWSYGIGETFTIVAPRIYGGRSVAVVNNEIVSEFGEETKTGEILADKTGMPVEQAEEYVKRYPAYWGPQPNTQGPVYMGAVVTVFFILGLVFYKGWHKGWLIAATVFGILLAWGGNFAAFNYFLFDNLPFYNKFRAPSMSLVIPQLTFPLLAILGLNEFIKEKIDKDEWRKKFKKVMIATGVLAAVLIGLYFSLDYKAKNDQNIRQQLSEAFTQQMAQGNAPTPEIQQQASQISSAVTNGLKEDRRSLYGNDLIRSLILMGLAILIAWLFLKNKITALVFMIGLVVLTTFDLIGIDLRYLNSDNYIDREELMTAFVPNRADMQIKQDTGYYRVFDRDDPGGPFQSSRASYTHNSIGGMHPAKLALYDDIIIHQLSKMNIQVYNMLNTKYFILNNPADNQPVAQQNTDALGPVWFVRALKFVNNANEEMKALDSIRPKDTAVLDKREQSKVTIQPVFDPAASIRLVQNMNDRITYQSNSSSNQFAVFSEVYYPRGWKAFIDGKETPIAKVNYILRGLSVPAGNHTIEFRFEPSSFYTGDLISLIVGIASFLILAVGLWWEWRNYNKNKTVTRKT